MKNKTNIFILLIAIIIAALAVYYLPTRQPEQVRTLSPNDYIQLKERKKEQRILYERERRNLEIKRNKNR
tara:strand:- start:94 stop:303 length:210 start_codon:yes stop_codon:yes gene_type:complete